MLDILFYAYNKKHKFFLYREQNPGCSLIVVFIVRPLPYQRNSLRVLRKYLGLIKNVQDRLIKITVSFLILKCTFLFHY